MSVSTLPSGQGHHFRDRAFKRSFLVSVGVHVLIIVAAGSITLFRMSGTTYAPSYTVDLVTLPPAPTAAPGKAAPAQVKKVPKPVPEKKVSKEVTPKVTPPPVKEVQKEIKPAGGDEAAARVERRKKIEELEMEARKLYESFTTEEQPSPREEVQTDQTAATEGQGTSAAAGGKGTPSNLRFRAYYDRIWTKIRSSWVVPGGVTSSESLKTVVGIRVAPNGEIEQFWIEERSGNEYYDQSALRAIRKANPLPPLPDELSDSPLEVGINFRYPE